jgi:hypothetical protein
VKTIVAARSNERKDITGLYTALTFLRSECIVGKAEVTKRFRRKAIHFHRKAIHFHSLSKP